MKERIEDAMRKTHDFKLLCGEVVRLSIFIERELERFITEYFVEPRWKKKFFEDDKIISQLTFFRKIEIFKQICENEELEKDYIRQTYLALEDTRKIRNAVAHNPAFFDVSDDGQIKLRPKSHVFPTEKVINIDETTLERIGENSGTVLVAISKLRKRLKTVKNYGFQFTNK